MKKSDELFQWLNTRSDRQAARAIQNIQKQGKRLVPQLLQAAVQRDFPLVRKWSLQALGELNDRRALPVLRKALKDPQMTVRLHAIRALARTGKKSALPYLLPLLRDESGGVRVNVLQAIAAIGVKPSTRWLKLAIRDPQWYVRAQACELIGRWQITAMKSELSAAARSAKPAVKNAALKALRQF